MGPILSREASNRTRGKDTGSVLAAIDRCPACRNREEGIARAASFLAAGLNAPDGTDRYGHPGLLCFPHLQTIAPRLREPILVHILKLHESAVASVMESLRNGLDITLLRALRLVAEDDKRPDLYPTDRISETSRIIRDPVGDFLRMLSDESACPVCLEARRAWAEWMQWLKEAIPRGWEVNDLLPTCPEHVRATVRLGDYSLASLTVRKALAAVLDLCCLAIDALATSPVPERGRTLHRFVLSIRGSNPRLREARHVIARTLPCPVCNRLAVARDRILALLFALLETPHHRSAYDRGYGLCLKHFSRAMALRPPTIARAILTDVEAAKLDLLQWELEESLRKDAWSNRPEAPGAEHTAWRRAIERFSGSFAGGDG
jgi:hypothetical protein